MNLLQENQKLISTLELDNKRLSEKFNKMNYENQETDKEKDFLRKKVDELQRRVERQSVEANENLKIREE
jgi:hypothetical protein